MNKCQSTRSVLRLSSIGLLAAMILASSAAAETDRHVDLELRAGAGTVCGTCRDRDLTPSVIKGTVQLFVDALFPIWRIGPGALEAGPYVKGALLDGADVPQIAGGLVMGYHIGRWEILGNAGFAYATEQVGVERSDGLQLAQTKHTYDLGLTVRYEINRYFISTGYTHNSNGSGIGLNYAEGKGFNPGYDQIFVGVGIRFEP